jgi:hypothetical protein
MSKLGFVVLAAILACVLAACSGGSSDGAGGAVTGGAGSGTSAADKKWVAAENAKPGDDSWRLKNIAGQEELAGYTGAVSVLPGEKVDLHLTSTLGPVSITAHRLGWYGGKLARKVWETKKPVTVAKGAPPQIGEGHVVSANWKTALSVDTKGWPEGSYIFTLHAGGKDKWVPVTLRSAKPAGRLVLVNAVATWQAYNQWGGYSLYKGPDKSFGTRSTGVSFDRPYDSSGAARLMNDELGPISVAEQTGLNLAYTTSWDLHRDAASVRGASGIVSLGHDEYWTVEMRQHVEAARDAGTNLAFLGANSVYWRVRFEDTKNGKGRLVRGYKNAGADPVQGPATNDMWRRNPSPNPENSLVGMLYECYPASGSMVIHDPSSFLFAGTGVKKGQKVSGVIGVEIDRAYPIKGTPKTLEIVAHSPVPCAQIGTTYADMTYYTAASGAGVVATGTMGWARAMVTPNSRTGVTKASQQFVRKVTTNIYTAMAAGPMAKAHPAKPNLAQFKASSSTSTGTGQPVAPSAL